MHPCLHKMCLPENPAANKANQMQKAANRNLSLDKVQVDRQHYNYLPTQHVGAAHPWALCLHPLQVPESLYLVLHRVGSVMLQRTGDTPVQWGFYSVSLFSHGGFGQKHSTKRGQLFHLSATGGYSLVLSSPAVKTSLADANMPIWDLPVNLDALLQSYVYCTHSEPENHHHALRGYSLASTHLCLPSGEQYFY